MKVLFVIHYPVFGGPHNQALRLAGPLAENGIRTVVLLPAEPGSAAERLTAAGVEVVVLPLRRLRASMDLRSHLAYVRYFLHDVRAIRRVIRERGITMVQIGGLVNPQGAIAARLEGKPVVWQLLDTRAPFLVASVAMVFVRRLATVVMSTGVSIVAAHPGAAGIKGRLVSYYPPVDTTLFRPRRELRAFVRRGWGLSVDTPVVGTVANLNPQKGITDLLFALHVLRKHVPGAVLVVVGASHDTHAAYRSAMERVLSETELVLGRDVILAGSRTDIDVQLQGFDVFALASVPHSEGISTAILEAMACALPVVATGVGGVREVIDDGETGYIVPPLDAASLADALAAVLQDPLGAERIGAAARKVAERRFSLEQCVSAHRHAYQRALTAQRITDPAPTPRKDRNP